MRSIRGHPFEGGVAVVEGHRELVLGGKTIVDRDDERAGVWLAI
ncbi:MAG: hypothetical protein R3C29_00685 [Dehalococcoidia bacterium]